MAVAILAAGATFLDIVSKLRQETAADHAAVEDSIPLMHPALDMAQYAAVLRRMYGVVAAWEELVAAEAPDWLRPLAIVRQRRELLQADLRFCHAWPPPQERPALPDWHPEALAGPMYVMEGSRLGGQMIGKYVEEQLGLANGFGDSYFRSTGTAVKPRWDELMAALRANVREEDSAAVIVAAQQMFRVFGSWMQGLER